MDGGATASYFYGPLRPEKAWSPLSRKKQQSRQNVPAALLL